MSNSPCLPTPPSPLRSRPPFRAPLLLVLLLGNALASRADLATALDTLRAIGPEGQGNAAATRAWAELAAAPGTELPRLLAAMKGASDRTRNYLFAAIAALADRETRAGRPLPLTDLGDFLLDTSHDPRSRRLAYDLVQRGDPAMAEALLAGLLDDPAPDLRREAVQRQIEAATRALGQDRKGAATILFQQALVFAREADQIEQISKPLKELGRPVDLIRQFGFLTEWKVIGPFDNTGNAGFDKVYPPEQTVNLDGEYDGRDGKVRWKPFSTAHEYGMVDFNKAFAPLKEVAGYASTVFHSDAARPAEIRLGCKNGWKIWFNGRFLFGRDEYHRGAEIDQYRLPIELKEGPNAILVKLTQNEQKEEWTVEWEFQLRLTDPAGRVIRPAPPNAQVAHFAPSSLP